MGFTFSKNLVQLTNTIILPFFLNLFGETMNSLSRSIYPSGTLSIEAGASNAIDISPSGCSSVNLIKNIN